MHLFNYVTNSSLFVTVLKIYFLNIQLATKAYKAPKCLCLSVIVAQIKNKLYSLWDCPFWCVWSESIIHQKPILRRRKLRGKSKNTWPRDVLSPNDSVEFCKYVVVCHAHWEKVHNNGIYLPLKSEFRFNTVINDSIKPGKQRRTWVEGDVASSS